ncbi:MAG: GYF domain-containing protein [Candidatus Cloacimonetes bacterium]|nr:GYF domain-containing protein [Candidatus Cloacimonadota bacterium]
MSSWLYSLNGKDLGPFSSKNIAEDVLSGKLELDSYVLNAKDNMWKKIQDVPEIMQIIHKPSSHPVFSESNAQALRQFVSMDVPFEDTEPIFYNYPAKKLLKMQILTLGMFEFYWFYKQWRYLSAHSHGRRPSVVIALFSYILFAYEILSQIEKHRELNSVMRPYWSARQLALLWYFLPAILLILPLRSMPVIYAVLSGILAVFLPSWLLYPVQRYINEVNEKLGRPESTPSFGFYFTLTVSFGLVAFYLFLLVKYILG